MAKQLSDINFAELLPRSIADDPTISAAAGSLDSEIRAINSMLDTPALLPRLDELPEQAVDLLAWQFHVDFWEPDLDLERKRNLVRESIAWHRYKGTVWAVRQALIWAGFGDAEIREHRHLVQSWIDAGGALLDGGQDIDGSTDLSAPAGDFRFMTTHWAEFAVRANAADIELIPGEQARIRRMVDVAKPARSHLVGLEFYAQYDLDAHISMTDWSALVRSVYDKCGSVQVPRFQLIGWGCREIGGSYEEETLSGEPLDGWRDLDGQRPAGQALDQGHWGTWQATYKSPRYTQSAGNTRTYSDTLDPNYRYILDPLDGRRDLSVKTVDGGFELNGKLDLSLRPITRQTYDMLDGGRHLGELPGETGVWHSACVTWWNGNKHYREAI